MLNYRVIRMLPVLLLCLMLLLAGCAGQAPAGSAPTPDPAPTVSAPEQDADAPEEAASPAAGTHALAAAPSVPTPRPEQKVVQAANVEQLLKAIAPDTVIELTGRSYMLSDAVSYGNFGSDWYYWQNNYDGYGLVIENVSNLTIRASRAGTEIVTEPLYSSVIKLNGCSDIEIEGLTVGHAEGVGVCAGAVLEMKNCTGVSVSGCDLYGCGTYGLELDHCRTVHTTNSIIRDCSNGAAVLIACEDVLFDGCSVYGIAGYDSLFNVQSCRDCALINSFIRSNTNPSFVRGSYTRGFYIAGCQVSHNHFEGMFSSSSFPLVMEGCSFRDNQLDRGWFYETYLMTPQVTDPDGHEYTDEEMAAMTLVEGATWSVPPRTAPEIGDLTPAEDGMIHVHNVDELLAAIGPDRTIYLEDGVYFLGDAADYGIGSSDYYYWMAGADGPGLVISRVKNLTLTAAGPHRVSITSEPRFADVISVEYSENVALEGFTAGHTQGVSSCAGGVLYFTGVKGLRVEDCSLYGCGIVGVMTSECEKAEIIHTEIHDCSEGALWLINSRDISIEGCNIHDIDGFLFQVFECKNVTADGRRVPEGTTY